MIKYFIILLITVLLVFCYVFSKKVSKRNKLFLNIILLILLLIPILIFFNTENSHIDKKYIPPEFDGKQVIPGYFDEKN